LRRDVERERVKCYIWNITPGGKNRPADEYRVQPTGVAKFEPGPGTKTLILGWWEDVGVFAGWDVREHLKPLAWISTDRNWPNIGACRPVLDEAERIAVPPGDGDRFVEDAGGEDDGEVGATMEAHPDFTLRDGDVGGHIDEVAEDEARLGVVVAAHAAGHETIEA
jgi:hypothetical protein